MELINPYMEWIPSDMKPVQGDFINAARYINDFTNNEARRRNGFFFSWQEVLMVKLGIGYHVIHKHKK